jgi:YggT family protein
MDPLVAQFTVSWITTMIWAIIARSLMSWFPVDQTSPIVQVLFRVTEPIIEPFRRVLPSTGMIDLSPMAAIFGLFLLIISLDPLIAES